MSWMRRRAVLRFTGIRNSPLASVTRPRFVPTRITATPGSGWPVRASVTRPANSRAALDADSDGGCSNDSADAQAVRQAPTGQAPARQALARRAPASRILANASPEARFVMVF